MVLKQRIQLLFQKRGCGTSSVFNWLSERKEIEANGISKFQKIVNQTITPQLLKWKGVELKNNLKLEAFTSH